MTTPSAQAAGASREEYRAFLLAHPGICGPRKNEREYMATLRAIRRRFGLCVKCGQPTIRGKTKCVDHKRQVQRIQRQPKHLTAHRVYAKRHYRERVEQGICARCGGPLTMFDPIGVTRCTPCRRYEADAQAAYSARVRAERRAAGLCLRCGRAREEQRYVNCGRCRAHAASYQRGRLRERAA